MIAFSDTSEVGEHLFEHGVLVVEDDALLRLSLAMDLRQAGFRVREAANAAEARAVLEAGADIDVVVTDIEMPGGCDGLSFARMVRATHPEARIIVVSGTLPDNGIVGVADAFFGKPYDPMRLVDRVKLLLAAPPRGIARRSAG